MSFFGSRRGAWEAQESEAERGYDQRAINAFHRFSDRSVIAQVTHCDLDAAVCKGEFAGVTHQHTKGHACL